MATGLPKSNELPLDGGPAGMFFGIKMACLRAICVTLKLLMVGVSKTCVGPTPFVMALTAAAAGRPQDAFDLMSGGGWREICKTFRGLRRGAACWPRGFGD